jgi:hypothetical protein
LLFADASTAGTVPPLFVAIPDHATAVDGGLSRSAMPMATAMRTCWLPTPSITRSFCTVTTAIDSFR